MNSAGSEFCFIHVSLTPDLYRCLDCQVCPPSRTRELKTCANERKSARLATLSATEVSDVHSISSLILLVYMWAGHTVCTLIDFQHGLGESG